MKSPESHGRPVDRTTDILRLDIHVTLLTTLHTLGPDPTTWPDRALSPAFALYTLTALSTSPVAAAALRAAGAVAVLAPLLLQTEANEAVSAALSLALLAGKVSLFLPSSFSPSRRRSLTTHPPTPFLLTRTRRALCPPTQQQQQQQQQHQRAPRRCWWRTRISQTCCWTCWRHR